MNHYIDENNIYHIIKDGHEILTIKLDDLYKAVEISTDKEVYNGPIEFLTLSSIM